MNDWELAQIKNTVLAHYRSRLVDFINDKTNPYSRTEYRKWKLYEDEKAKLKARKGE